MFKTAFMRAYYAEDPYQASLPPLGIGYLISYAKQKLRDVDFRFCRTLEEVLEYKPDLFAISSATENFLDARSHARVVKAELGIPVIGGGMHLTAIPRGLPPEFDLGSYGEGEVTFAEVLELYKAKKNPQPADFKQINGLIYRDGGMVVMSPRRAEIEPLDSLPYPDREALGDQWLKPYWQQAHMISSRGCPYDCSFCSSGKHWRGVRYFGPEYTALEIEYLRERYNPREIYFFDDLMIANKKRFKDLCHTFAARGTHQDLVFRTYARVDLVDEELAEYFEKYNFRYIDFGFEANTNEALAYYNKRLASPEINQRAIDILKTRNISIGANIIIGAPPETREMALESFRFIERNKDVIDRFNCALLLALPGTEVWFDALRRGVVSEDMNWAALGFNSVPDHKKNFADYPLMSEQMSRAELWAVYLQFKDLMRHINTTGEKNYWIEQFNFKARKLHEAAHELETLKGSRLVRAAMWLRGLRQRVPGNGDAAANGNGHAGGNGRRARVPQTDHAEERSILG